MIFISSDQIYALTVIPVKSASKSNVFETFTVDKSTVSTFADLNVPSVPYTAAKSLYVPVAPILFTNV